MSLSSEKENRQLNLVVEIVESFAVVEIFARDERSIAGEESSPKRRKSIERHALISFASRKRELRERERPQWL